MRHHITSAILLLAASTLSAGAYNLKLFETPKRAEIFNYQPVDSAAAAAAVLDTIRIDSLTLIAPCARPVESPLESYWLRPAVFDKIRLFDGPLSVTQSPAVNVGAPGSDAFNWINEAVLRSDIMKRTRQKYIVNHPDRVRYNEKHLPEPPREFVAVIDPETASIVLQEVVALEAPAPEIETDIKKRHWLRKFSGDLQFSQAYVSPNWYQGGNNNLNMLINVYYEVKLNQAFHPKWIFDNTFQYKLGTNNTIDDKVRDYTISEDILQWNMTAGYKTAKHWYYSVSAMFKTQILNNYKANTDELKASFLSPGELNVGVGMTYSNTNKKKTLTFDASISPLSWNMKTCINKRMDPTAFGIKEGRTVVNEIGSSGEAKLSWKICDNVSLRSRLFVFSDYSYIQGDWENTLQFTINRFLSTQIYAHARYDSTTKRPDPDSRWHKLQIKEILSFGFSYKFGTL
ncbi:MAG: DUF3078 domain-containing protein [Duncaniella sp.]|nr:DUF3078 domain-containing protein [Duncaniella sp.]